MLAIVAYNERWPEEFAKLGAVLRQALGDLALRIDHIGSTAVPGLAAKDIIDVQVTVDALEPVALLHAALNAGGYTLRPAIYCDHRPPNACGPEAEWHKRMAEPPPSQRPTNVHIRVQGRANQRYALLFRDYLRAHPPTAAAYADVKRRLVRYHAADLTAYAELKDPICDVIMGAAEEWAAASGWQPGRSGA